MSTYLGNPALSTAVKDRVSSTFHQALALYRQGRIQEVVAGCTLILQMDPLFDPAKKLLEKARNPSSPIDVETLSPTTSADDALREARKAMTQRDFQRVIQITTEVLTNDLMNDDARILGDEAREKMEAGPFVEQFAKKCEQHLANGNLPAAKTDLEKARSLDPDHPMIKQIEKRVSSASGKWPVASGAPSAPPAKPSFVVDNPPPAASRSTAQASDFGFTFEEEKQPAQEAAPFSFGGGGDALSNFTPTAPASFSFDAPAAPSFSFDSPASSGFSFDTPSAQKAPATGEFDFSTASIETSAEDQRKIDQYLADGDRAAARGDYQEAIDLWSRVFLIDVTNETASDRIEKAKLQRRDIESKMDVLIAAGAAAFDRGNRDEARAKFAEVLRLDPHNVSAQDYMDRIAEQEPGGGAVPMPETPYVAPPAEKFDIFADVSPSTETLMPPDPETIAPPAKASGKQKAVAAPVKAKPQKARSMPTGALLTILAIALLGAGGWYAWQQFANRPPAIDPAATQQLFARANGLANKGQYDQAIALLQDVKPDDPQHDRALNMIADLQKKKSQAAEMVDGKPAAQFYQEQVDAGRAAFEAHDYVGAKKAFEQAQRVKPIPDDVKPMYETAAQQVAKLDAAKALFNERRYSDAIGNLQPLLTADPSNKNIARMITDAHFNLGATALQEEKLPDAMREFDEVLRIDPNDELARRSRELAVRYNGQPKDLLYKIYVKYLPLRQVT